MCDVAFTYKTEWFGNEIIARARRALARGLIGTGMEVVVAGKRNAHVDTGTMRRSIHLAPANFTGGDDYSEAYGENGEGRELPNVVEPTPRGSVDWVLLVGSWVPYACVEEVGRGHQFMTPAMDIGRSMSDRIMAQAFAEEGLA